MSKLVDSTKLRMPLPGDEMCPNAAADLLQRAFAATSKFPEIEDQTARLIQVFAVAASYVAATAFAAGGKHAAKTIADELRGRMAEAKANHDLCAPEDLLEAIANAIEGDGEYE